MVKMIICHAIVSAKATWWATYVLCCASFFVRLSANYTQNTFWIYRSFISLILLSFCTPLHFLSLSLPVPPLQSLSLIFYAHFVVYFSQTWYTFVRFNALPDVELSFICFCFSFIFRSFVIFLFCVFFSSFIRV